jgi:thiamine biosynthesis lipoprotein
MADVELQAIGTTASVKLTDRSAAEPARGILARRLDALDRAASHFRDDSELMLLQRLPREPRRVSRELFDTTAAALWAARVTGGAVDPTAEAGGGAGWQAVELEPRGRTLRLAPGARLDFGATGKALAADRIAGAIHAATGAGVLVSLGGDIAVAGDGEGWPVGIADDHRTDPQDAQQVVRIDRGGLATSSTCVRSTPQGHHILDPLTGEPAAGPWRTVSVAASSCLAANAASTAAIVMGDAAPAWLERQGLPARLVAHDGEITLTAGWPE